MKKSHKIIYWVATGWLALGMTATGIVQLIKNETEVNSFSHLGYPDYLLSILGIWKILGVIAVLVPKLPVLKEWAYAGFFFAMSGALISHIAVNDAVKEGFGPALLLILTGVSWYMRPPDRKCVPAQA
jgi:uncharacterized membrane protein